MTSAAMDRVRALLRAPWLHWILGGGVALLSVWLLARELNWALVVDALARADYAWVALGVLTVVATLLARVWRWQALLWEDDVPFFPAMTALLVGQAANLVLPARGGDLVRVAWIGSTRETGAPEALGSVALEKVWDLVGLLLCGLLLLPLMALPDWFARSTWGTAAALAVSAALLWIGLRWQEAGFALAERLLARFPAWAQALLPPARRTLRGLESVRHGDASARALLWTVAKWGLGAVTNWTVMQAFGVPSIPGAIFLLAALMVGGVVAQVPARIGVFEGITVAALALFGVPADVALAVGLVLHLVTMGPPLIAAALSTLFWGP